MRIRIRIRTFGLCVLAAFAVIDMPVRALGQSNLAATDNNPLVHLLVPAPIDTGDVQLPDAAGQRGAAYTSTLTARGRPWMRLQLDSVTLGRTPPGGQPTVLRITSLLDGAMQIMNASHLQQWRNSSAYFNGDSLRIEIICDADAPPSRLTMSHVITGEFPPLLPDEGGIASICGGVDDRVLSSEPGNARLLPSGCTAWLINDANRTFLTAGHCGTSGTSVIEFNVPLSTASGALQHPPPEDQYVPDAVSIQSTNGGIGNDFCYFGCFPNTNTNLTPFEAQGEFYTLASAAPQVGDPAQEIRITGYGTVSSPVSPTWNQVQKTHSGPYDELTGTTVRYATDTTGGNSGSPVFDLETNTAIGIHTNAGCNTTGGSNQGTAIHNAGLQTALANPQGVCIPNPALDFVYPDGRPANIDPAGDTLRVEVIPGNGGTPQPGTAQLHLDTGSGFVTLSMTEISPNVYDAVFPASVCGDILEYYVSAENTRGDVTTDPLNAPDLFFSTLSATAIVELFSDNFQTDQGWSVANTAGVTTGFWQRVVPSAGGDRGDPANDADGSGMCFVTDNTVNNDIDGGTVTLTSPVMDASAPGASVAYWRWFTTSSVSSGDTLIVEVSDDGGASWLNLETYAGATEVWTRMQWRIDEIAGITPNDQFRIRFRAGDVGSASVVEAGVDGVQMTFIECGDAPCPADTNGSGAVDVDDLVAVILAWGDCPKPPAACDADIDDSGAVDVDDLVAVILAWGACP